MSRSPDPFLILGHSAAKGSPAPKGRNIPAQGKALGHRPTTNPSPEGAAQQFSTDESPQGCWKTTFGELVRSVSINDKKLPAKQYAESGKFPVVDQGQQFIGGYSDDGVRVISDELPLIVFGDHTRIFKYLERPFVPGADGIKVLKPIGVDAKWLFHIAHALDFPDKGYARHFQHLKQASVFVPPLPEQRRIVARIEELFSRLDAGVAALLHAKAQLQRYRQAVLAAAVTGQLTQAWREQNPDTEPAEILLKRVQVRRREEWKGRGKYTEPVDCDSSDLKEVPRSWTWSSFEGVLTELRNGISKKPDATEGLRILRISAIRPLAVDLDDSRFLSDSLSKFATYELEPNDLLFTRYNGTRSFVGVCGLVPTLPEPFVYPDKLIRARLVDKNALLPSFVEIAMNAGESRRFLEKRIRTTAGQSGISGGDIKVAPLPIPPLAEQQQIVAEVEARTTAIEHLEAELDRQITRSNRFRQSTLSAAFAGRL